MNLLLIVLTGAGATALTDIWGVVRQRWLGIPPLDFALVGRWVGHMRKGRFFHHPIAGSTPITGERVLGWIIHYLTGIAFAGVLLVVAGDAWFLHPTLLPALATGIGCVAAPFFIMQPALGAGVAASRSPHPAMARLHSLVTHAIFGLGLYATAWMLRALAMHA